MMLKDKKERIPAEVEYQQMQDHKYKPSASERRVNISEE